MDRLSSVDAAWFHVERTHGSADIVALMHMEGALDFARLRGVIEAGLLPHRQFTQRVANGRLGLGPPRWQNEPAWSLDAHVTRCRLPERAGEAELLAAVNVLLSEPLDFTRSPWRLCLLEGGAEGSTLFAQIHHCMGDGFALLDLLLSLADERAPSRQGRSGQARARTGADRFEAGIGLARRAPRVLADSAQLLRLPFDPPSFLRGEPSGVRRVALSAKIELARVKALARARGATVNDLLVATLAGALRRYAAELAVPLPDIHAIVPVNLRPAGEPIDPAHGNWFGLVFVPLPVEQPDREARLLLVQRTIAAIKRSEQPIVSLGVLAALGRVPASIAHAAQTLFARKGSLVFSNVPGPREPFHFAGRRVRDLAFWVPHPAGLTCGISVLSYAGRLRIGVRSDSAVVADPSHVARCFEQEFADWPATPPP